MDVCEKAKPLAGTLWLGSAGAVLMIGGLVALLAANWHTVPLGLQMVVALLPLGVAWCGYGWARRRGVSSLGLEEVLGVVWAGGVLCSIALLGRVLQLASSSFLFCATVSVLLLPVMFAVRSTAAWIAFAGFAFATAFMAADYPRLEAHWHIWAIFILAVATVLVALRIGSAWRTDTPYAVGQRTLGALGSLFSAGALMGTTVGLLSELHLRQTVGGLSLLLLAWPLMAGVLVERKCAWRPLSFFGAVEVAVFAMVCLGEKYLLREIMDWRSSWIPFAVLLVVVHAVGRWMLRGEGLFLLLLPIVALTGWLQWQLLGIGLALAVGALVMVMGVLSGRRMLANEGLLFVLVAGWVAFGTLEAGLVAQGVLLLVGGLSLVVLNVVLARLTKGGRHA